MTPSGRPAALGDHSDSTMGGKKIILALTGSIAAYKSAFLLRLLVKAGAEVQVLMTQAATRFIAPLTLSTLSKKPVLTEVTSGEAWNNHVELGSWADAMIIAPATANTLAKLANGFCDNIVTAVYLSARCPVYLAPAMDLDMWKHPATVENVKRLQLHGNYFLPVGFGELASGLVGEGRMAEPEDIVAFLNHFFQREKDFSGKNVLVTAGPTYEAIDPVRFIGNRSSGKMGVAIAEAFAQRGASVQLLLGPSLLQPAHSNIQTTRVESAQEMYEAALKLFEKIDIAVLAAAVADYRPKNTALEKIKKTQTDLTIELEKTPDIAAKLGERKRPDQIVVGFALETNDALKNATEKLVKKNFDFIVLNSLQDAGAGFNFDTNKITFLHQNNKRKDFELKPKSAVAEDILNEIISLNR